MQQINSNTANNVRQLLYDFNLCFDDLEKYSYSQIVNRILDTYACKAPVLCNGSVIRECVEMRDGLASSGFTYSECQNIIDFLSTN